MTFEEAKKQLQELIFDTESLIVGDAAKGIYRKDLEALKMAVEVLEKQIPKKPIENEDRLDVCSICGYMVLDEMLDHLDYCPRCGQALDWSDKNE